jgi:hypothetical protein
VVAWLVYAVKINAAHPVKITTVKDAARHPQIFMTSKCNQQITDHLFKHNKEDEEHPSPAQSTVEIQTHHFLAWQHPPRQMKNLKKQNIFFQPPLRTHVSSSNPRKQPHLKILNEPLRLTQ